MAPADSSCVEIRTAQEQKICAHEKIHCVNLPHQIHPETGLLTPELTEPGLIIAPECSFNHLFQWTRIPQRLLTSDHLTKWIEGSTRKEHLKRVRKYGPRRAFVGRKTSNTEER